MRIYCNNMLVAENFAVECKKEQKGHIRGFKGKRPEERRFSGKF